MSGRWSVLIGAIPFAIGAVGAAIWLSVKRRQLALAAAEAAPERATEAATDRASAVPNAMPDQSSAVPDAAPELRPSGQ
jgi:hypothetical protein